MNCWTCTETASATCRFCGRATCSDHARTMPYVLSSWRGDEHALALVVEDAIYCGTCRPHPSPIQLDIVLDEARS